MPPTPKVRARPCLASPALALRNRIGPWLTVTIGPQWNDHAWVLRMCRMSEKITALAAGALLLSSLSLGGCATSTARSSLMDARAEAPAPPKTSVYPLVGDLPPKREQPAMTPDERLKLQKELITARDRQAPGGKARGGAARAQPMKP
jgi:hypothetical protein